MSEAEGRWRYRMALLLLLWALAPSGTVRGDSDTPVTPVELVRMVLDVSAALRTQSAIVRQRRAELDAAISRYYPTFKTSYTFEQERDSTYIGPVLTDPDRDFTWAVSFDQPLYHPVKLSLNHALAELNLQRSKLAYELESRSVIHDVLTSYLTFLKARKQLEVARTQVEQITAHEAKSSAFFTAGKIPRNDLLDARVRLANARQSAIVAENRVAMATADINLLLRRPPQTCLKVVEALDRGQFESCLDDCQEAASQKRIEIRLAEIQHEMAQIRFRIARRAYHPTVDLNGFYYRKGTRADLHDTSGMHRTEGWQIKAELEWTIWSGNRRRHQMVARLAEVSQSRFRWDELRDTIAYEVQQAFLNRIEANRNISVMAAAVDQAEENLRLNQARFAEQLAAAPDVLDAQALLTTTRAGYVNAVYDEQLARTALKQVMGGDILEGLDGHHHQ